MHEPMKFAIDHLFLELVLIWNLNSVFESTICHLRNLAYLRLMLVRATESFFIRNCLSRESWLLLFVSFKDCCK